MKFNSQKILVMGGSFNPPTIAHLEIMRTALRELHAEKGYFVPVSYAYLKRKMSHYGCSHMCIPDEMRLKMLDSICENEPRMEVCLRELSEPFSITYRVMEEIQEKNPKAKIIFIAGADKLSMVENWGRKTDFLERFGVAVFTREDIDVQQIIENSSTFLKYKKSLFLLEPPEGLEHISSTKIRENMFEIELIKDMLPPSAVNHMKCLKEEDFVPEILSFQGEYQFLDNGYPVEIIFEGKKYLCAEAAFQASKSKEEKIRERFTHFSYGNARNKGAAITPYEGWEAEKLKIMEEILRYKFSANPDLKQKLLETKNKRLIAGNTKKENFWGMNLTMWRGNNHLGELLMKIREDYMEEERL